MRPAHILPLLACLAFGATPGPGVLRVQSDSVGKAHIADTARAAGQASTLVDGATLSGSVRVSGKIDMKDGSGNIHPLYQTVMSGVVATNSARPTTATVLAVTPTSGQAFSIPAGTLTAAGYGQIVKVSLGLGMQFLAGAERVTIKLQTTSGVDLLQWGIDNRGVNYPSGINSCLELTGWIHPTSGGSNNSLNLQAHSEYHLNGYWAGQPGNNVRPISLGLELYPSGINNTVDIPLQVVIYWDAQLNNTAVATVSGAPSSTKFIFGTGAYVQKTLNTQDLNQGVGAQRTSFLTGMNGTISAIADNGVVTVAFAKSGNQYAWSYDGGNAWRAAPFGYMINDVCWNATLKLFCAVGNSGIILTSPDGLNWTLRTSGTTDAMYAVTASDTYGFLASTNSGNAQYLSSPDGVTWTVNALTSGRGTYSAGIAANGATIVIFGGSGAIYSYVSGTWGTHSGNGSANFFRGTYNTTLGKFIGGTSAGGVYYSSDALTWTAGTSNTTSAINQITSAGGVSVAVGNADYVGYSTDGITFNLLQNSGASSIYGDWIKLEY